MNNDGKTVTVNGVTLAKMFWDSLYTRGFTVVMHVYCQVSMDQQAGKQNFFGTRPNWVVSYIAYTKFHSHRPVFHSPGQNFTRIGERASARFPAWIKGSLHGRFTVESSWHLCFLRILLKQDSQLTHCISLMSYRKTSSISHTKSQNLNVSCILLQLSSLNPLKPCVKLRMKM